MKDRSIASVLVFAMQRLSASPTPDLDAKILLSSALKKPVSYLYTWPNEKINDAELELFESYLLRREVGEPVAYILGQQAFWSLNLKVTPDVLIPRPETELLVEAVLKLYGEHQHLRILDLGTGSGAIALALASEKPNWDITATDVSENALKVAIENKDRLKLSNVKMVLSDWFAELEDRFDVIVSNPPYIPPGDQHLFALSYEPEQALVASDHGLSAIKQIIHQAPGCLQTNGRLFLEHGYDQAVAVKQLLHEREYKNIEQLKDYQGHVRISAAEK